MRICIVLILGLILPQISFAAPTLPDLAGVYRGYAPTDASALAIGEIELIISKDKLSIRMATGLRIENDEIPLEGFEPMTKAEVAYVYKLGSRHGERSFGFKGPSGHPQLIFLKDPKTLRWLPQASEFGLVVKTGGLQDYLGPTVFLSPVQLQKVSCGWLLRSLEFWSGGRRIPRLDNNGLAPAKK